MSQENVKIVRSLYADWERGDYGSGDWADPEIEWAIADGPAPGSWKGIPGMVQGWRQFLSAWDDWHSEAHGYRDIDDERVLVLVGMSGRGKASGLEAGRMGAKAAHLLHLKDGKVTKSVIYFDRRRALEEVGLDE
jgi:ketosteroid isomerase-like protein